MSVGHPGLLGFSSVPEDYPIRATLWGQDNTLVRGPATKTTTVTDQPYNHYEHWSGTDKAVGNALEFFFPLRAGLYSLTFLGRTQSGYGLVDWYLDGTLIAARQDWYSAVSTSNVTKTLDVAVRTSGNHTLYGEVVGKNPSSGDYDLVLTKAWLTLKDEGKYEE